MTEPLEFTPPLPSGVKLISQSAEPIPVERYRFNNGLTLLFHPDPSVELVSFQTWVAVGSAHERPGKTGLAHLFEHLMFKATQSREEGVFDREIEEAGGSANAATWLDWTYYYEEVPSAHLERVIALEVDRLNGLLLNSEQLEAERKVVMNERRECVEDDPDALMDERLWSLAFKGQPYGHPTIGWMDDIEALSLEDCLKFYRGHYAPDRVTVVVSGAVERAHLLELMRPYQALEGSGEPPEASAELTLPAPLMSGPVYEEMSLTLHAPRVSIGLIAPPVCDARSLALECLDELFNQGDSSRLHRAFVLEREWATGVYSAIPNFRGHGLYELSIELAPGAPVSEAIELFFTCLEQVAQEGLEPGELEKVKRQKELGAYRSLQTLQQRAHALGFWELVSGDYLNGLVRPSALEAVSAEELRSIARELLDPARRFVVVGLPSGGP